MRVRKQSSRLPRWGVALVATAAAVGVRVAVDGQPLGGNAPFLVFAFSVVLAALYGGRGPGLLATVLGLLAGWYLFIDVRHSFSVSHSYDALRLIIFLAVGTGISLTAGNVRDSLAAAQRSEERFRLLLEGVTDTAIFAVDLDGCVESWNAGAQRVKGYTAEQAIGRHISSFYTPEDRAAGVPDALLCQASKEGVARGAGWRVRGDGTWFWAEVTLTGLRDARGRGRGYVKVTRDRTEAHEQRAALEESAETTRALLESASQAIVGVASDGSILSANTMAGCMFGYPRAELLGIDFDLLIPHWRSADAKELVAVRKDGAEMPVEISLGSANTRRGPISVCFITDISDRKRSERALRDSEQRFRLMADSAPMMIWVNGLGGCEYVNRAYTNFVGRTLEDVQRMGWSACLHPDDAGSYLAAYRRAFEMQTSFEAQFRFCRADGQYRWFKSVGVPRFSPDGAFLGYIGSSTDITDLKEAERAQRLLVEELLLSEQRLSWALQAGRGGAWDWDLATGTSWWSTEMYSLWGVQSGAPRTLENSLAAVDARDRDRLSEVTADCIQNRREYHCEFRIQHPEKGERWMASFGRTLYNGEDMPVRMLGITLDITDRKQAEAAVRESEERFRTLADHMSQLAWMADETGRVSWYNQRWYDYTGTTLEEMQGSGWRKVHHPDHVLGVAANLQRCWEAGEPWEDTFPLRGKDGSYRWFLSRAVPVRDGEGRIVRWLGTNTDITEKLEYEDALQRANQEYKTLAENAPEIIARFDRELRHTYVNAYGAYVYGIPRSRIVGKTSAELGMPAPMVEYCRQRFEEVFTDARQQTVDFEFESPNLGCRHFSSLFVPELDHNGEVASILAITRDLTTQRETERKLRESKERLRLSQQVARVGTFEWNIRTNAYHSTPEMEALYGLQPGEFNGTFEAWSACVRAEDLPEVARRVRESLVTGEFEAEWRAVWPDGSNHWVEARGWVFKDETGNPERMIGVNMDITERKQIEQALRLERDKLTAVFDNMETGVVISDAGGHEMRMNAAALRYHGFASNDEMPAQIEEFIGEWELTEPDGTAIPVEQWPLIRAMRGDFPSGYEAHVRRAGAGEERIFSYTGVPLRDAEGRVAQIVLTLQDITERKQREQEIRRLNAELEQRVVERTAQLHALNRELESFAYSVSHDLRAPLRGIDGWSLALAEDYEPHLDDRARGYLHRIRSETQHMGMLIDDLLQLSRVTRAEMRRDPVDLSSIALNIAARLRERHASRRLDFVVEPGLAVTGDPRLLEVALTNLLANAAKFTCRQELGRVEVGRAQQHGEPAFYVRDNGVGFDMVYAKTLFGAFQRLHKPSDFPGTGIGLATVQRVIHRHGGKVWAEAQVDRGATFYFTLPGDNGNGAGRHEA